MYYCFNAHCTLIAQVAEPMLLHVMWTLLKLDVMLDEPTAVKQKLFRRVLLFHALVPWELPHPGAQNFVTKKESLRQLTVKIS